MSRRRVLHCIPGMGGGGAERQLAYLSGELGRLGWEVHVALVSDGPNYDRLRAGGVTIHRLQATTNYDPRLLTQLLRVIARVQPDLMQLWVLQMEILGAIAARLRHVPWILSERCSDEAYPSSLKHHVRARLAAGAAAIVSNSSGGDLYWQNRLGPGVRRYVIPNALPLSEIASARPAEEHETGIGPNQQLVLFAGRLTAQKNPEGLIRALLPVLERPSVTAVIAGEGPMLDALTRLLRKLRIDDRVRLPGFIANIWAWMKRANVFVSPTLFEGHPNSVMEAMACGCPVVLSDIPPHREFADERNALLVPPGDRARLSAAILDVLDNPGSAGERANEAARIVKRWSIEHMAREYDRVYANVLASVAG